MSPFIWSPWMEMQTMLVEAFHVDEEDTESYSIDGVVHVTGESVCGGRVREHDAQAADALSAALSGEPVPSTERDGVITWATWGVD